MSFGHLFFVLSKNHKEHILRHLKLRHEYRISKKYKKDLPGEKNYQKKDRIR